MKILQNNRYFIWAIVFIVVSLGGLATYVQYVAEIDSLSVTIELPQRNINNKLIPWEGKWVAGNYHTYSTLTISKATDKDFHFNIDAYRGSHLGQIAGIAQITKAQALAQAHIDVYESPRDKTDIFCDLSFTKNRDVIKIIELETGDCTYTTGVGVYFDGEYKKDGKVPHPTIEVLSVLKTPAQQQAFSKLVGKYLYLFTESNMITDGIYDDDDNFSASVSSGSVAYINSLGNIIMVTKDSNIWAAVMNYDSQKHQEVVYYFTNVEKYKKQLPETIQNWIDPAGIDLNSTKIIYQP
jgi:hypothetical protein